MSHFPRSRSQKIEEAMRVAGYETGSIGVVDMLADIRHYCDSIHIEFGEVDRYAKSHYRQEIGGRKTNKKGTTP